MPKPKAIIRPVKQTLNLSEALVGRMELELYSGREGRIPQGAKSTLINSLLESHFAKLDEARRLQVLLDGQQGAAQQ